MEAERGRPPRTRPSPAGPALPPLPRLRRLDPARPACRLSSALDVPARPARRHSHLELQT